MALVITRKPNQSFTITHGGVTSTVTVMSASQNRIVIAIDAPREVLIERDNAKKKGDSDE